jgi:hypothetical protein
MSATIHTFQFPSGGSNDDAFQDVLLMSVTLDVLIANRLIRNVKGIKHVEYLLYTRHVTIRKRMVEARRLAVFDFIT